MSVASVVTAAVVVVVVVALGLIVGLAWVDYTDEADHQRRMARAQRRRHG